MRLINVHTLDLEDFWGKDPPAYAILSHTWGTEEVSFQDWKARTSISHKAGFDKIIKVAQIAEKLDLNYVWVDTNCIDKTSSAELSEAINSMFAWYSKAEWCLVHLDDVPSIDDPTLRGRSAGYTLEALQHSRWFTRGWTLQELIAPACLAFFSQNWQIIGYLRKVSRRGKEWTDETIAHWFHTPINDIQIIEEKIVDTISHITGIARATLVTKEDYVNESIAVRMHWASKRRTTRVEDMAYCLFGLFNINMPLLYGEGKAAFQRLQEEIMKVSIDQSIFAWSSESLDLEHSWPRGRALSTTNTLSKPKLHPEPRSTLFIPWKITDY
ncbi:HET-domain-containing protein [Nemania diffusa]|nr:HET-domain-containing protein [Nemania diffusa]